MSGLYRVGGGTGAVKISKDAGNELTFGSDSGLYAPAVGISKEAGNSVTVAPDGGLYVPPSLTLSQDPGNELSLGKDQGLYLSTPTPVVVTQTNTDVTFGQFTAAGSPGGWQLPVWAVPVPDALLSCRLLVLLSLKVTAMSGNFSYFDTFAGPDASLGAIPLDIPGGGLPIRMAIGPNQQQTLWVIVNPGRGRLPQGAKFSYMRTLNGWSPSGMSQQDSTVIARVEQSVAFIPLA